MIDEELELDDNEIQVSDGSVENYSTDPFFDFGNISSSSDESKDLLNKVSDTIKNDLNSYSSIQDFMNSKTFKEYRVNKNDLLVRDLGDDNSNMQKKNLVQSLLGLSNINIPKKQRLGCIECFAEDEEMFEEIVGIDIKYTGYKVHYSYEYDEEFKVDKPSILYELIEEGKNYLPTIKYLLQDIFFGLYKYRPILLNAEEMFPETRPNRFIMERIKDTPEFIALRKNCRLDDVLCTIGTEIIGRNILDKIKKNYDKLKLKEEDVEKMQAILEEEEMVNYLQSEMQDLLSDLENLMDEDDLEEDQLQELLEELQDNLASQEESQQSLEDFTNDFQAVEIEENMQDPYDLLGAKGLMRGVTDAISDYIKEADVDVTTTANAIHSYGLDVGQDKKVPFATKRAAAERLRLSTKLKDLVKDIGKLKESAIVEQKKKAKTGAVEIKSVSTGNKIEDTLPSERMNLLHEATKMDFHRRMNENQLFVYEKEQSKIRNKGPIICCVDMSGSMEGSKERWSKALTVAVLEIAQMQKRDFACILYDSKARKPITILKDEIAPQKIMDIAEIFSSGGTQFEYPLEEAMKLITESSFKEADILFITDGESYLGEDFVNRFNKVKEEKDFRCIGILVNLGSHSYGSTETLKKFCDSIATIDKLAELTDAESDTNRAIFAAL